MIVSWDYHGVSTSGPIWEFTTETPLSNLNCEGNMLWTDIKPGSTVSSYFIVENIGIPESLLDWEIDSYPEWGTWTFDPENGEDLTPEAGSVTVGITIVAPDESNSEFTGEIRIVNSEDSDDFCIIDVSLATPVNQPIKFPMIQWLLERFPNMFPILRNLLEAQY